jgi:predicted nucleotidyltransferase
MDKETLISYAEGFVSFLLDTEISKKIDRIILFGSVARGDFDKESDVDIFVDTDKEIDNDIEKILDLFKESETYKKWKMRGVVNDISIKTGDLEKWSLRRDVISNGIILYGKYSEKPKDAKYYLMINLRFRGMKRNKKIMIWRKLYGYTQKVGPKTYEISGLIDDVGGKKIEKSLIVVPMEKRSIIINFLNKNNIDYALNEIWSDTL